MEEVFDWIGGHWSRPIGIALTAFALMWGFRGCVSSISEIDIARHKADAAYYDAKYKAEAERHKASAEGDKAFWSNRR